MTSRADAVTKCPLACSSITADADLSLCLMIPPRALSVLCLLILLGPAQCQEFGNLGLSALGDPLPFVGQLAKLPQQVSIVAWS